MNFHNNSCLTALAIAFAIGWVNVTGAAERSDIVDTAVAAGSFNTLAAALEAADLVDALKGDGPFTVFAPTDKAFANLPEGTLESLLQAENQEQLASILTYHVVSGNVPAEKVVSLRNAGTLNGQRVDIKVEGDQVQVDNASVVTTDIRCSNGTIHVIDAVILPSQDSIPAIAEEAGTFKTLLAAAKAAGLVEALSGEGPITLFAPTDDAFDKLPEGTVESLLLPENKEKLASILKYHVVDGRVFSDEALRVKTARTLLGDSIRVSARGGRAKINDANLISVDIDAANGVIHVIDRVLLPPEKKVSATDGRHMIEHAVARGSRLFNSGHHAACADLYMQTARQMVEYGDQMPPMVVTSLTSALSKAENSHCSTQQSWTMRRGLDRAYHVMRTHVVR